MCEVVYGYVQVLEGVLSDGGWFHTYIKNIISWLNFANIYRVHPNASR